jgi:hypothetical protein
MTVAQLRRHAFVILASTGNFMAFAARAIGPAALMPGGYRHGGEAVRNDNAARPEGRAARLTSRELRAS